MLKKLTINSVIENGKYKGYKVKDIIKDKSKAFTIIKEGINLDDEALALAGIKKRVSDVKYSTVVVEHEKDTKVYQKDTQTVDKIINELTTLGNPYAPTTEEEDEDDYTNKNKKKWIMGKEI